MKFNGLNIIVSGALFTLWQIYVFTRIPELIFPISLGIGWVTGLLIAKIIYDD